MDKILILDFGSQTTQLIARRIRESGVYTDIVSNDISANEICTRDIKGIIFSGSPESVYTENSPSFDKEILSLGLPVLGICYGIQRIMHEEGGAVVALPQKEYGQVSVSISKDTLLTDGIPSSFITLMSHGDSISKIAPFYQVIGTSLNGIPSIIKHSEKDIYGVQFHPEVTHCDYGLEILHNFVYKICKAKKEWSMKMYLESVEESIQKRVKNENVLLLISGGVDSTVAGALLLKILKSDQVYLLYIDTGLMRKAESEEVMRILSQLGAKHLQKVDASTEFLSALKGLSEPEAKRKVIGDLFITIQEREVKRLNIPNAFLAQGTLYTDLIESGKGVGKKAHVIKSHHNVRSPLVEQKRALGQIIEPLDRLYKDEVRALGRELGLHEDIVMRHPFPGPGLAVRILGEVTEGKCNILRNADAIFIAELKKRNLYNKIWQAFCVLLPVQSVGVAGDERKYGYVLALRAIVSHDGMTANVYPFEMKDLTEISTMLTNSVKEIGRVVYDISSKPPATIEWE